MCHRRLAGLFICFLLAACTPVTEAPQPTQTPTVTSIPTVLPTSTATFMPTPTPIPMVNLEGVVFFDINGNGRQGSATVIYTADPFFERLFPDVSANVGDLISVNEPALAGYKVCFQGDICSTTDNSGGYSASVPYNKAGKYQIRITNPPDLPPQESMNYYNIPISELVFPADPSAGLPGYSIRSSDQFPITKPKVLDEKSIRSIGLTQGIVTLPFIPEQYELLDARIASNVSPDDLMVNYLGETLLSTRDPWNCSKKTIGLFDCISEVPHIAIDYGFQSKPPEDVYLFASYSGVEWVWETDKGIFNQGTVYGDFDFGRNNSGYMIYYGHAINLVPDNTQVKRGQMIGILSNQGDPYYYHVHWELQTGKFLEIFENYSPAAKTFFEVSEPFTIKDFNDTNHFTIHNTPAFADITLLEN